MTMKAAGKIPVAAVVGPTASGKSRLAVEIALRKNGEVVSADSMQIYRGMEIGTAQPDASEMRGVPHHLTGFADPGTSFSVAEYTALARDRIAEIHARGKLPVLAGGTGLYICSLLHRVEFAEQQRDDALRAELFRRAEREGAQSLWKELREFDPESAVRIHPNNVGRVVRAIEIYRTAGITMTEQIARSHRIPSPYRACVIGLAFRSRAALYERINRRVDAMLQKGLAAEAKTLFSGGAAPTAAQAIGYKEFLPYFRGECTLAQASEEIKRETRRYAKRQMTWFRRDAEVHWILMDDEPDFGTVVREALAILAEVME